MKEINKKLQLLGKNQKESKSVSIFSNSSLEFFYI
jgi:hypothetical protein